MNRSEFIEKIEESAKEDVALIRVKNADYANNEDPFANFDGAIFVGVSVERGILIRIMDKIKRISNLLEKDPDVAGESIYDSLRDARNYLHILEQKIKSGHKLD